MSTLNIICIVVDFIVFICPFAAWGIVPGGLVSYDRIQIYKSNLAGDF